MRGSGSVSAKGEKSERCLWVRQTDRVYGGGVEQE